MDNQGIKAVIFDLGNVCIDFDHMIAARKISRFSAKTPAEIFNLLFDAEICRQFEEGRITPADFFSGIAQILNLNISYAEFLPVWNEIFFLTGSNAEVHHLIKRLKHKYRLAVLSNINVLHFEYLKANFSLFSIFDELILSYQQHLRKPDPLIYKKSLEILNLSPRQVFYSDDKQEFTQEAGRLGIRSYCFQNPGRLKSDLLSTGINTD